MTIPRAQIPVSKHHSPVKGTDFLGEVTTSEPGQETHWMHLEQRVVPEQGELRRAGWGFVSTPEANLKAPEGFATK